MTVNITDKLASELKLQQVMYVTARRALPADVHDQVIKALVSILTDLGYWSFRETCAVSDEDMLRKRGIGPRRLELIRRTEASIGLSREWVPGYGHRAVEDVRSPLLEGSR